jgi:hypothetical protein
MVQEHRSPVFELSKAMSALTPARLKDQRLEWVAARLLELNPKNLFYRYLYLETIGGITENVALEMVDELLHSPAFPRGSLPMDCDRDADYLWQRDDSEYVAKSVECREEFAGIDFLWMAGLLGEKLSSRPGSGTPAIGDDSEYNTGH